MPTPTVELLQAFLWTCDECGRDNFERAITVAPESIDLDDLSSSPGVDADAIREWVEAGGEGNFLRAPGRVTCPHCGAEFETEEP